MSVRRKLEAGVKEEGWPGLRQWKEVKGMNGLEICLGS